MNFKVEYWPIKACDIFRAMDAIDRGISRIHGPHVPYTAHDIKQLRGKWVALVEIEKTMGVSQ